MLEKERLDFICMKTLDEYNTSKDSSNIAIGVLMAEQAKLQSQINSHANAIVRYDKCIDALTKLKETEDEKYYYEWLDLCSKSFNAEEKVNLNDDIVIAYISARLGRQYGEALMDKLK